MMSPDLGAREQAKAPGLLKPDEQVKVLKKTLKRIRDNAFTMRHEEIRRIASETLKETTDGK